MKIRSALSEKFRRVKSLFLTVNQIICQEYLTPVTYKDDA